MKRYPIFLVLCFLWGFAPQNAKSDDLEVILRSAGDYCEKVKDIALYYVAKERIKDVKYIFRTEAVGTKKRTVTYDYQLISRNGRYEEKRTLLEENGKKKHQENVQPTGLPFVAEKLVFGPVGFLSRYWQAYFRYEILGRKTLGQKLCVVIKATPKKPPEQMEGNNKIARIWLDVNDHSILRIEVEPQSIEGFQEKVVKLSKGEMKRTVVCRTEYDVEKNGIRFPGTHIFRDVLQNPITEEQVLLEEISYAYSDYKMLTVGVEIKY